MRKPGFIETRVTPGEKNKVADGFLCGHCYKMVTVKPFEDPTRANGFCSTCMSVVCRECAVKQLCMPFMKEIERLEARSMALRSYGLEGG